MKTALPPIAVASVPDGLRDEMFRRLVWAVTDYAIFLLTPEGRVASWNAGAERIKGYRASQIVGEHFSRFYTPDAVAAGWPDARDGMRAAMQSRPAAR